MTIIEQEWFEIKKVKSYLYIIRERLDKIEPRFLTKYTNLYLIIGEEKALLIDTGSGLFPLKKIVQNLIKGKELIVINTHSDFDHIGGNYEFKEIFIHYKEKERITNPQDISMLKTSQEESIDRFAANNFKLKAANKTTAIKNGHIFDLGNIKITCLYTPGHSIGSISLLSSENELFTGDLAHYGAIYLPERKKHYEVIDSLEKLLRLYEKTPQINIYPSHEQFGVGIELLVDLKKAIKQIDKSWENRVWNEYLSSWIIQYQDFQFITN